MRRALIGVALLVAGCDSGTRVLDLDRRDPSGDRALVWPDALDSSSEATAGEPALRAFTCTKQITGKRTQGQLQVSFVPTAPTDVLFRVDFRGLAPDCSARSELRLIAGRLDDGFLGRAYTYRCRRSPHSMFAVSCGPYLGSDLTVLVRGNGWGRTVSFRVPPSFLMAEPRTCQLPFVLDDSRQIDNGELVFDLAECKPGP